MSDQASIAILGGGPSGLCLGILLHKQNIPFTLYELRGPPTTASLSEPSGMLDLRDDSGLLAMRACGLEAALAPHATDCGEGTKIMDGKATVTHEDYGGGDDEEHRPEIPRNALSHLLAGAVPEENVRWHKKLVSAERTAAGKIALTFADGAVHEHDLVVGADGAWSKVRPLVTDVQPSFGGVSYAQLHIVDAKTRFPVLSDLVGDGMTFMLGGSSGVVTHRGIRQSISAAIATSHEDESRVVDDMAGLSAAEAKEYLLSQPDRFGAFDDRIKALVAAAWDDNADTVDFKPMYMMPIGHSWDSQPGATLIGDAAHLMMPWAGQGVNLALWDSLSLSEAITAAWTENSAASTFQHVALPHVARFEKAMHERVRKPAEFTHKNGKLMFSEDGAVVMGKIFDGFRPAAADKS